METLCRQGTWYTRAVAAAPWTLPSTASILSGALPTEHGISGNCLAWKDGAPSSPKEAVKAYAGAWLPELLRERGYRTFGTSCNRWVSTWGGFERGFDAWHDAPAWTRVAGVKAGSTGRRARRGLGDPDRGGAGAG